MRGEVREKPPYDADVEIAIPGSLENEDLARWSIGGQVTDEVEQRRFHFVLGDRNCLI